MGFPCRSNSCGKQFSTKFNCNKHERIKRHFHGDERLVRKIPFNDATRVYMCPTINCRTSSKYKHNIIKHLKYSCQVNSNKKVADNNKIYSICHKHFLKRSNRDCHMKTVYQKDSENIWMMTSTLMKNCQVSFIMSPIKVKFPRWRLNQKYQYSSSLQNQVSFLLFLHLNLLTYVPPHLPAWLPTRLLSLPLPHLPPYLRTRLLSRPSPY